MTKDILDSAYMHFFKALDMDGVAPIVEAASELFQCPVLLTDENYGLICQYPHREIGEGIWDHLFKNGALPLETIREYQEAFLQSNQPVYEPFYANWGLTKDAPRIFGEVYTSSHRILGHVAVFLMGRDPGPYDLELTRIFIDALRIRMSSKSVNTTSNATYLCDLLSPNTSAQRKMLAIQILMKRLKGNFCLMVTSAGNSAAQRAFASNAVNHLNNSFRNTVSTVQDDCIVTLFGEVDSDTDFREKEKRFLTSVASFLLQSYAYIGISSPFASLADIDSHFYQGYLTAQLKQDGVHFFADVVPAPLFVPALQNASADTYMHPVLRALQQYDASHGTEYYQTLKVYSFSMHDKDKAARKLCIHRNTLLYRLNRIQDIFGIPYENEELALYLLNSFQIWELAYTES